MLLQLKTWSFTSTGIHSCVYCAMMSSNKDRRAALGARNIMSLEASPPFHDPAPLTRVDVAGLAPSQISELLDLSQPMILSGIMSEEECEAWCDAMIEDLGDVSVDYQVRTNFDGRSMLFRSSLADFIDGLQEESNHEESWYLLEEDLLVSPQARPNLRMVLQAAQDILGPDEFEHFPRGVRPQKHCAIIGGVGARSFLHSDPMEWMGWNILLEGRKLWTFLPPLADVDGPLGTYRVSPNAFGSHEISAGRQSDIDLYRRRSTTADGQVCPCWPSSTGGGETVVQHAVSGMQEEGDLVLIPPRHWHQVYHLEPSVAVASQWMDERVRDGVFRHILNYCGAEAKNVFSDGFDLLKPAQQVARVLKEALVARYGRTEGLRVFSDLTDESSQ